MTNLTQCSVLRRGLNWAKVLLKVVFIGSKYMIILSIDNVMNFTSQHVVEYLFADADWEKAKEQHQGFQRGPPP